MWISLFTGVCHAESRVWSDRPGSRLGDDAACTGAARAPYEVESAGQASRQLMAEHEVILEVLYTPGRVPRPIASGRASTWTRTAYGISSITRNFTDRCHHGKEERFYFPAAEVYAGQRVYGFIDELTAEHAYGRSIMDEIDYLLEPQGRERGGPDGSPSGYPCTRRQAPPPRPEGERAACTRGPARSFRPRRSGPC